MTLEEMLAVHVHSVRQIAALVPPGDDVAPMLAAFRDGALIEALTIEPLLRCRKPAANKIAARWLHDLRADAYAATFTAWTALLTEAETRDFTGPVKDHPRRLETVMLVVGDRSGTLTANLEVIRSESGEILELRGEPDKGWEGAGLLLDLLCEPRTRH